MNAFLNRDVGPNSVPPPDENMANGKGPNRFFFFRVVQALDAAFQPRPGAGASNLMKTNTTWPGLLEKTAFHGQKEVPLGAWSSVVFTFQPHDPVLHHFIQGKGGQFLPADGFFERAIIAWIPEFIFRDLFPHLCPPCPKCKCSKSKHKKYIDELVDVYDLDKVLKLLSRR